MRQDHSRLTPKPDFIGILLTLKILAFILKKNLGSFRYLGDTRKKVTEKKKASKQPSKQKNPSWTVVAHAFKPALKRLRQAALC